MSPAARRALALGVAVAVAAHLAFLLHRRSIEPGDYDLGRELGRRLLAGEPLYAGGLHYPYAPSSALVFAPLALTAPDTGFVLRYLAALGALGFVLHSLAVAGSAGPRALPRALATLALGSHYVLRDLADAGPHLIELAILTAALRAAIAGRAWISGLGLGLAAAFKATAAIFLPFLLWRREWRLAATAGIALVCWSGAPALWMGPSSWLDHERQWASVSLRSAIGAPIAGARESEARVENQALRPALERVLGGLGLSAVGPLAGLGAAVLVAAFAAATRAGARESDADAWLRDWASVLVLSLLLAPVAWVQHLVLALPAIFLAVSAADREDAGAAARAPLALFAFLALGLNREILGRNLYRWLLGVGLHTACMLLLLALVLRPRILRRLGGERAAG